jgi:hypothetical protein
VAVAQKNSEDGDDDDGGSDESSALFSLYKIVGHEDGVAQYLERWSSRANSDWSGAYFQLNMRHCLGTLGYRWDQGYLLAKMYRVTLGGSIRVVADEFMADPNTSGDEKARRVKRVLGLREVEPLMAQLDGGLLLCRETDEEWEMVCAVDAVPGLVRSEALVCEFRRSSGSPAARVMCRFPVDGTSSAGSLGDGDGSRPEWQRFDESSRELLDQRFGPNELPGWAQRRIRAASSLPTLAPPS